MRHAALLLAWLAGTCSCLRVNTGLHADSALQCDVDGNAFVIAPRQRVTCSPERKARLEADMTRVLSPCREAAEDMYRKHWAGKRFPLSKGSIQKASAPYGHSGALLRLQSAVARLLQDNTPLAIAVLGGSVTSGMGSNTTWARRMGEMFADLGRDVRVRNLARPATTSKWALGHLTGFMRTHLEQVDIVMVDYTVNDDRDPSYRFDYGGYSVAGSLEAARDFKELISMLLNLPRRPAVLAVETLWQHSVEVVPTCTTLDVRKFVHWRVEEELDLPVVSYTTAVCPSGGLQWLDNDGDFCLHPNAYTHDLIARTMLGSLLLQAESVCEKGVATMDHPQVSPHSTTLCLAHPTTSYTVLNGKMFFPSVVSSPAWNFEEDVPGKPGWVATAAAPPGEIAFHIETKVGWIQVEFLGTYENIGAVSVWLDSSAEPSCLLDGLWADRSSQSRFSLMKTGLPPGRHTLHFRSQGAKFKLLGIVAC